MHYNCILHFKCPNIVIIYTLFPFMLLKLPSFYGLSIELIKIFWQHLKKIGVKMMMNALFVITRHLFWECQAIYCFWDRIQNWVSIKMKQSLDLSAKTTLFGLFNFSEKAKPVNFILLLARYHTQILSFKTLIYIYSR